MRQVFVLALLLNTALLSAQTTFQEITPLPFLDSQSYLNGVSWADVDNDGDLDVCVTGFNAATQSNASAIYLNDGAGNFTASTLLVSNQKNTMRHAWADFNNDDYLDLYIGATWNQNGINELWQNNAGASLTLNQTTGITPNVAQPYEGAISWADYNNDGWVDLFLPRWNNLGNRLFKNNGNGTFTEVATAATALDLAWTSGGFWGDYDNDGDQDLFVVNYQIGANVGTNDLFRNNGDGTFTKITTAGQLTLLPQNGRSANWVDANNDGFLDLFVCNQFGQDELHLNNGDGTFTTHLIGAANHTSWSSNWGDFDNDGDQDLITIGFFGTDSRLWQNDGFGNLTDVTASYPNIFPTATNGSNSNAAIWVDADLDGWLDLHIIQPDNAPDHFYHNAGQPCKSWLEVKCTGQESNHAAIGASIRIKSVINGSPVWQMRQISSQTAATGTNPLWQHFGCGDAALIDSLVLRWPSGKTCVFTHVAVNQVINIKEDCSIEVMKSLNNMEGTFHEMTACLPLPAAINLTPTGQAGGIWYGNCADCINQQGMFSSTGIGAGDYLIRYLSSNNVCGGTVDSFLIHLLAPPVVTASGPDSVDFKAKVKLSAGGAVSYLWQPSGSLSCANCSNPEFTADSTTLFVVTGTGDNGCTDTAHVLVYVRPEPTVNMPNAFTPNNDQNNDEFRPANMASAFTDYKLKVYDRWGERVFESFDIGEAWDGTINGNPAASDVYVYVFDYALISGKSGHVKGQVTLLR